MTTSRNNSDAGETPSPAAAACADCPDKGLIRVGPRASDLPGLDFIVLGASGDLAVKKIFPALFSLYCRGNLPKKLRIFGFARTKFSDAEFRERIAPHLACRQDPRPAGGELTSDFLAGCFYHSGLYDSAADFSSLVSLRGIGPLPAVVYMAVPSSVVGASLAALRDAGLAGSGAGAWRRFVVEKPFGRDRPSSDALAGEMQAILAPDQIYRIDHYLGKAVVQGLMALRFANIIFEPIWNRQYVANVRITWKEDIGTAGRAGYFDEHGIIRDVMQNHLLQILALCAMEPPIAMDVQSVCSEKVKLLRCVEPPSPADVILGQYAAGAVNGKLMPGYLEEPNVPPGSITPTFAAVALRVRNRRWDGVPFFMSAGKGLDRTLTEIRVQFQDTPGNIFSRHMPRLPPNEFVIRVQPESQITFHIVNRAPGLEMKLDTFGLDLLYSEKFGQSDIPEAYECLLLDLIKGDQTLFINRRELDAAWDVFTPLLREIEQTRPRPALYHFGCECPENALALADKLDIDLS